MKERETYLRRQEGPRQIAPSCGAHTVHLRFADEVYRFSGLDDAHHAHVTQRFEALLCDAVPDPVASAHFARGHEDDYQPLPEECWEYDLAFTYEAERIQVAGHGFDAGFDRETLSASVTVSDHGPYFAGTFENLFRILVVYRLAGQGTVVMHSAAVVHRGRGFVLFGRSGAGKTTVCTLLAPTHEILSDELNAIRRTADGLELVPMPFAGDFGTDGLSTKPAPLRAMYALKQAVTPGVEPCRPAQAIARIVAACPFVNADPYQDDEVFDRATSLTRDMPLRVLSFPRDPIFWETIEADVAA